MPASFAFQFLTSHYGEWTVYRIPARLWAEKRHSGGRPRKGILREAAEAMEYEWEIIEWIVNGYESSNLSSVILKEFIKNRMNESLIEIGFKKIFEVDQEILKKTVWFDEQFLANSKSDFFNSRPVEYSRNSQSFDAEAMF